MIDIADVEQWFKYDYSKNFLIQPFSTQVSKIMHEFIEQTWSQTNNGASFNPSHGKGLFWENEINKTTRSKLDPVYNGMVTQTYKYGNKFEFKVKYSKKNGTIRIIKTWRSK